MKNRSENKFLGTWFYKVYRRTRYIRYIKKIRKQRKKQDKLEKQQEDQLFKKNVKTQRNIERQLNRLKDKQKKLDLKQEKKQLRAVIKERSRVEKIQERKKKEQEKKELELIKAEAKQSVRKQSKQERELTKLKTKQLKEEEREQKAEVRKRLKEKNIQDRSLTQHQKNTRKQEKKDRKRRKKKLRPYLIKRRTREIVRSIRSINSDTFKRWLKWFVAMIEDKTDRNTFFSIAVNSLSLFILSYLTLYIIGELITVYVAKSFEYNTVLYYFKIYYNIDSDQWTADAVKILYSIKPVLGLVLGTVAIILYSTFRNDNHVFKIYFLWLFVHGMVMFFGSLLMGTLLNQGFGWVIAYLYYRDTGKMIFSIFAIFALVITGSSIAKSFLISGNAYFNYVGRENRKFLLISQILIPVIVGTIILSFLKIPTEYYYATTEEVVYEILKLSTIVLVAISIVLSFSTFTETFFDEEPRKIKLNWIYLAITSVIYFAYRLILQNGIEFTI